jgi:hypothetical protein
MAGKRNATVRSTFNFGLEIQQRRCHHFEGCSTGCLGRVNGAADFFGLGDLLNRQLEAKRTRRVR